MSLLPMKCNFVRWVLMLSPLWIGIALEQSSLAQPTTVPPSSLPKLVPPESNDWLVGPTSRKSGIFQGNHPSEIVLDNGLIRRTFLTSPNLATVGFDQLTSGESILRSVRAECRIAIDGKSYDIGGLVGQPLQNFLRVDWYPRLQKDPEAFVWDGNITSGPITERMEWKKRSDWLSMDVDWPPKGIQVAFRFEPPQKNHPLDGVSVTVHYALYDGLPLIEKWFTLSNGTSRDIRINHFTAEILSCVEASSQVEDLAQPLHPNLHIETDMTSVAMHGGSSQRDTVHWRADPSYTSQVNYRLESQCLLEVTPPLGPNLLLKPGQKLDSFRTWELALDRRDEVRQTLALARMYRTIAPWVLENPLIHHVRSADPAAVRLAIEQCSEVGFELIIMTFGSGFQMENESPSYLEKIKELADEAHRKKLGLGGYSLLASRSIGPKDDVVNPATGKVGGFARFGNSPCLESQWGNDYFRKLYQFFEKTGCDVLEHDGSYPGDPCASTEHPGHEGYEDSRWKQWVKITDFYKKCRSQGVYLNVPDWYFLSGSNKTGMGYRETNWSLPRDLQEIIERQNIYDGTRYKLPSMGWMFVPLTQYHGGGAEATIEPLDAHRDHYERRLQNLLGAGVQACYRGPRLYDTQATKEMVTRWVAFFKSHRAILESPMIGLRRADGRDWDGWLHVNPSLPECGLAMIYNPLPQKIERSIKIPLYYAGLREFAMVRIRDAAPTRMALDRTETLEVQLELPPQSATWLIFSK